MSLRIELSEEQMGALDKQAAAYGITIDEWLDVLVSREAAADHCRLIAHEAAARILAFQKRAKSDLATGTAGVDPGN